MAVSTRSTTGAPPRHVYGWLSERITRRAYHRSRDAAGLALRRAGIGATSPSSRSSGRPGGSASSTTASTYELTRFAVLRLLGLVYLAAFGSLALQLDPLLGSRGLLPIAQYLAFDHDAARVGGVLARADAVLARRRPTARCTSLATSGLALSGAVAARRDERPRAARALGALPVVRPRRPDLLRIRLGDSAPRDRLSRRVPLPDRAASGRSRARPTPKIVIWLLRWLVFRVMLGAALIKLRNDPCWRDLTCLDYHFETQPNPNPLAWSFTTRRTPRTPLGVLFEPLRGARGALVRRRAPPLAARRGRAARRLSGVPHLERKPLVSQLAHDRARARVLRRHGAGRASSPSAAVATPGSRDSRRSARVAPADRAQRRGSRRRRRFSASGRCSTSRRATRR